MPTPPKGSVTVRFVVEVPCFDYEAKLIADSDEETENQIIQRGKELLDKANLLEDENLVDFTQIRTSHGEEL